MYTNLIISKTVFRKKETDSQRANKLNGKCNHSLQIYMQHSIKDPMPF